MATRKIELKYGEGTVQINRRVPISKRVEIEEKFDAILFEYRDAKIVEIEVSASEKSNPADFTVITNPPTIEKEHYSDNPTNYRLVDNREFKTEPISIEPFVLESRIAEADYIEQLPKTLDEIYDCVEVDSGIPDDIDRIYHGTKTRIAFWDKDDPNMYYVLWEDKHYLFGETKEFRKFLSENNIK